MMRIRTDGVVRLELFPGVPSFSPFDVNDQITFDSGIKLRASHLSIQELGLTVKRRPLSGNESERKPSFT